MELTDSDLIGVLFKLVPGFFGAAVFHAMTPFPKRDVMDRLVLALLFTGLGEVGARVIEATAYFIGRNAFSFGDWNPSASVWWSGVSAVLFSFLVSWIVNLDRVHKVLRKAKVTKKTSFPSQWFSAFSALDRYVILELHCGRRLMGWPREWPDDYTAGHFWMEQASWLLDDGSKIPLLEIEAKLVKVEDVKGVEFMRFKDDPLRAKLAKEIEESRQRLKEQHKEA